MVSADTDPEVLNQFNQYIYGQAIGIPALVLGQQLFSFLSLENQTKRTMVASIACFVVNAIFNHAFVVFVPLGTFGLGITEFMMMGILPYLAKDFSIDIPLCKCYFMYVDVSTLNK